MSQNLSQQTISGGTTSLSLDLPRLRIEHLWMLAPVLVVLWAGFMHPLRRLDFWWHLKVGEIIVTSGKIPHVDLFSYTRAGQPFIYQNWLGEVLYYLVYRAGGFPLMIFFNTVLLLLALVPVYHLCLEANDRLRVAILCSLLPAGELGLYSNMRPQTYSFVLFAVFFWALWRYRERRSDHLWLLPLLMILWVNLHGAFVLGVGLIGAVLGTEVVRTLVRGANAGTLEPRALAKLALVLGLALAATLANPETYRVYAYVHQLQVDPASQLFVSEWQVPNIKEWGGIVFFFGPFFGVMVLLHYARRRLDLTELGLLFTFTILALAAIRSAIWFAMVAAPIVARHASPIRLSLGLEGLRDRPRVNRLVRRLQRRNKVEQPIRYHLNWTILALMLLFTIMVSPWVRPWLGVKEMRPSLLKRGTPIGAMDYIAGHKLVGHIFHPQEYGDYLIWRLWPQQRSFFDGRVHLYDEAFVQDYLLLFHDDNWESRLARYDIKYLLLPKDDSKAESMIADARKSRNWALLYEDDVSVLFEKQHRGS